MDFQEIVNMGLGAILCALGWFARQIWDDLKKVKSDVDAHKLHVSETYVKKSEIDNLKQEMDRRFDRLEDILFERLDKKADK